MNGMGNGFCKPAKVCGYKILKIMRKKKWIIIIIIIIIKN
jgi:hypothetical protein